MCACVDFMMVVVKFVNVCVYVVLFVDFVVLSHFFSVCVSE